MTIDESITELEKARDSIEPYLFMNEAIDQSMKTAIEIMHKYQKIQEVIKSWENGTIEEKDSVYAFHEIYEVVERI